MNEEEKEKVKDLLQKWLEETKKIKDTNRQPSNGARLDNGNSGEYTKLTKKYQKLIEKRIGKKIWNK
jgi:hypothetical protein|nr:MAG TPA: hypothetical protein [Caudoviricetes sp.]